MKILITGCNGFLGSNIIKSLSKKDYELIGTSREGKKSFNKIYFEKGDLLDIKFVKELIRFYNPDVIINTVALTDVDFCEKFPEEAYKLNVLTAENIAKSIEKEYTKLIHISSDQLFNGNKLVYSEEDNPAPLNIYGKTKLESEKSCLNYHKNTIIVRTNFFGWSSENHKPTFAEWIFNSLKNGKEIKMFNDVFFSPIEVSYLIKEIEKLFKSDYRGILNISGNERISKYEIGIKIAEKFGFDRSLIKSVKIDQSNLTAIRPLNMSLSVKKYEELFNSKLLNIEESLKKLMDNFPNKRKNIILGAGMSGLSLAYHLEKAGESDYILLESKNKVGGLCTSIRKEGFIFDLSVHMLHLKDERIVDLIKDLLGDELILKDRKAGIFLNGKIIPYPLQYNLYYLDEETKKQWLNEIIEISKDKNNKAPKNFEEWIRMSQGEGIADNFMIPYNQKCYSIHPRELTVDCGGRYVPSPDINQIIGGANSDMSSMKIGYNYNFYYTKSGGIDFLAEAFAKKIRDIRLNEEIIKIDLDRKLVFTEKEIYSFVNLINTIPMKKLIGLIKDIPEEVENASNKLRYTKICVVLLGINRPNISSYQWLYLPQKEFLSHKLSFPMNYSDKMTPLGMSSICIEYSYEGDRKFSDEEIIERMIKDLIKMDIIKDKEEVIFNKLVEMNPGYVLFDFNREKNLKLIKNYLREKNIFSIGRYGAWEYSSMEEAIVYGEETAKKLMNQTV